MPFRSLNLAVEGILDEAVLRRILREFGKALIPAAWFGYRGKSYLHQLVSKLNASNLMIPWIIIVDLDCDVCPPDLIESWTAPKRNPQIMIRVAVKEVESWLLAHREGISRFLGINEALVPVVPDGVEKPKEFLINLARKSRKTNIKKELVPALGSTSKIGKGYTAALRDFVEKTWEVPEARQHSPSLDATVRAISQLAGRS